MPSSTDLALFVSAAAFACAIFGGSATACDRTHDPSRPPLKSAAGATQAQGEGTTGMKAYVDPRTGKLTDGPVDGAEPLRSAAGQADEAAKETPAAEPAQGGGVKVRLGRESFPD